MVPAKTVAFLFRFNFLETVKYGFAHRRVVNAIIHSEKHKLSFLLRRDILDIASIFSVSVICLLLVRSMSGVPQGGGALSR